MALVLFLSSEPNRVSLRTSQNEIHRGQFGHFALTIYKHFALHKSRRKTLITSISPKRSKPLSLNSLSIFLDQNHKNSQKLHQFKIKFQEQMKIKAQIKIFSSD